MKVALSVSLCRVTPKNRKKNGVAITKLQASKPWKYFMFFGSQLQVTSTALLVLLHIEFSAVFTCLGSSVHCCNVVDFCCDHVVCNLVAATSMTHVKDEIQKQNILGVHVRCIPFRVSPHNKEFRVDCSQF